MSTLYNFLLLIVMVAIYLLLAVPVIISATAISLVRHSVDYFHLCRKNWRGED